MKKITMISSAVLFAFATFVFIQASFIVKSEYAIDIGPSAFPKTLAILLALLSVSLFLIGAFSKSTEKVIPPHKRIYAALATFIIYCLAFESAGFILSSIFVVIVLMLLLKTDSSKKTWALIAICSITFPIVIYLIFSKVLLVGLPTGILESLF